MDEAVKEAIKPKVTKDEVAGQIKTAKEAIQVKQNEIEQAMRIIEQYKGIVLYCEHLVKDYDLEGVINVPTKVEGQNS